MQRVIWITGLPGSGKSTLAVSLQDELKKNGEISVRLDGDEMRTVMHNGVNFDRDSRLSLAKSYQQLAKIIVKQQVSVIVSTVSLFFDIHDSNRELFENYFEVFLDVDQDTLAVGDRGWLYSGNQDVPGVNQAIEIPRNPNLHLKIDPDFGRDLWLPTLLLELKKMKS
jgi:adenylylsulfate kinase-like enzyme